MAAGLYVHVPFCVSKCPYCDFYSIPLPDDNVLDRYTERVCEHIRRCDEIKTADTLYFGGGTPSLLGGKRIAAIIRAARERLLTADAEITLEANPADSLYDTLCAFAFEGGNRLSLGMQAASDRALCALGRRHNAAQLDTAVRDALKAGITNYSLDIMLATPSQTVDDVKEAVDKCVTLGASHVSAYLLKLEEGTPFYRDRDTLILPDEDGAAQLYLLACEELEHAGFMQYEISNFAKAGCESRHNLKYWNGDDYLGIGPSAHSFLQGKRWYYERSLEAFLQGNKPLAESDGDEIEEDSAEEYAMLQLRLTTGLRRQAFEDRFGRPLPPAWQTAAKHLPPSLVTVDDEHIALTRDGFLLSNALIARILWDGI